ncbi:MAG TPA: carboxymuconolactone decarboxylase family protein [Bauldia sp.]|nr:carboxymuconolactone decarboxylase family protein [Bauldia sp.]
MAQSPLEAGIAIRRAMFGSEYRKSDAKGAFGYLDEFIVERYFGELWNRKELDLKTRSLCTIALLVAAHMPDDALRAHVVGALANGATEDEIREVIVHTGLYVGVGVVLTARPVAEAVFDARKKQ